MDPTTMPLEQAIPMPLLLFFIALGIFLLIAIIKVYMKAGRKGWEAIIPFYSTFIYFRIIKLSWWWLLTFVVIFGLLLFKQTVLIGNLLHMGFSVFLFDRLANRFGRGGWFTLGLVLLPFVFFPILAWGKSKYIKK